MDSPSIWGKNVVRMGVGNSGSEWHSSLAGGNATSPWLCHSSSPGITNGFIFFLTPFRLPFDCLLLFPRFMELSREEQGEMNLCCLVPSFSFLSVGFFKAIKNVRKVEHLFFYF